MRHLPGLGPFEGTPLIVDGHLRLMAAVAILAVLVMYAALLWALRRTNREQAGIQHPKDAQSAHGEKRRRAAA